MPTNRSGTRLRSVAPILVVEDDATIGRTVADALIDEGYLVVVADTLAAARTALERARPTALVLDLTLPDSFGADLLAELASTADAPPTVLLSVFHLASMIAERYDIEHVTKPFEIDALVSAVKRAIDKQRKPQRAANS
jgi:DNA-binding response OmpR family regulator